MLGIVMTNHVVVLRVLRSFDGIVYAISAMILLFLHPSFGRNELGNPDILCILPFMFIGWFSHRLPITISDIKNWNKIVLSLRLFATAFICLFPFTIWRYTAPGNSYFLINSQLAIIVGMGFLIQFNTLIFELACYTEDKLVKLGSRTVKFLIIYFLLVPFLALTTTYYMDSYIYSLTDFDDFYRLLSYLPFWLRLCIWVPLGLFLLLVYRMRLVLTNQFELGSKK